MVTKVTYPGLTARGIVPEDVKEGEARRLRLVAFFPPFSHDFAQPYHRPFFVVRATDPAIGGCGDLMAA
jgi:hypothetical protein